MTIISPHFFLRKSKDSVIVWLHTKVLFQVFHVRISESVGLKKKKKEFCGPLFGVTVSMNFYLSSVWTSNAYIIFLDAEIILTNEHLFKLAPIYFYMNSLVFKHFLTVSPQGSAGLFSLVTHLRHKELRSTSDRDDRERGMGQEGGEDSSPHRSQCLLSYFHWPHFQSLHKV